MAGRVAVIGAGSWGTTVASLVSSNSSTILWARSPDLAERLTADRCNQAYLPDIALPDGLEATADLEFAGEGAELVIMAVPSHGFRAVLAQLAPSISPGTPVISLTKGLEQGSHRRMTQVVAELLPGSPAGVLTGPNLAAEVIVGQPTASVVALADQELVEWVQELLDLPPLPGVHQHRRRGLRDRRGAEERAGHRLGHLRRPGIRRQHPRRRSSRGAWPRWPAWASSWVGP